MSYIPLLEHKGTPLTLDRTWHALVNLSKDTQNGSTFSKNISFPYVREGYHTLFLCVFCWRLRPQFACLQAQIKIQVDVPTYL